MAGKAIYDWSTTAADNGTVDASLTQAEGMAAGAVNNSSRQEMAREAAFIALLGGNTALVTYGGAGNAYTVASPSGHAFSAFPTGLIFTFIPNATNSGAATLALDGMAAKDIKLPDGTACPSGAIVSGVAYLLRYTGTEFRIVAGAGGVGLFQPKDADLDTWAGLTPSANFQTLVTQTFAQMRDSLDLEIGVNVQAYDADLTTWAGLTPSANFQSLVTLDYGGIRTQLALVPGSDVQAFSSNLLTLASVAPGALGLALLDDTTAGAGLTTLGVTANGQSLVTAANYAAMRTLLSLGTAALATIGTSGDVVPKTNTANAWSANQSLSFAYLDLSNGYDVRWGTQYLRGSTADYVRIGVTNNFFVTSTSGTDLMTLDSAGGLQVGVALSSETGGTLTVASRNKQLRLASNPTIPASVFTNDNMVMMRAMGTARTITRGAGLAMYVNGVDVATCTLSARGTMVAIFDSATVCTLHGDVS